MHTRGLHAFSKRGECSEIYSRELTKESFAWNPPPPHPPWIPPPRRKILLLTFPGFFRNSSHSPLLEKACKPRVCISGGVQFGEPLSCISRKANSSPSPSASPFQAEAVEVIQRERGDFQKRSLETSRLFVPLGTNSPKTPRISILLCSIWRGRISKKSLLN